MGGNQGFSDEALQDAYQMAAAIERLEDAAGDVYDFGRWRTSEDFEEPTFDPRNPSGSRKRRGSDSLNSSDVGVKLTPKTPIFMGDEYMDEEELEDEDAELVSDAIAQYTEQGAEIKDQEEVDEDAAYSAGRKDNAARNR